METNIKLHSWEEIRDMIISGKLVFHHCAARRGYCPVKADLGVESYNGIYGNGYVVKRANLRSTLNNGHYSNRYFLIEYYIYK